MSNIFSFITIITTGITTFCLYRLHSKMLVFRFHSKYYLTTYFLEYLLLVMAGCISDWIPQLPLKFIFLSLAIIYPIFLYIDKFSKRVLWIVFSILLYGLCEILILFIVSFMLKSNTFFVVSDLLYQTLCSLLANFLMMIITEIIVHSKKGKPSIIDNFRKELLFLVFIDVIFIIVTCSLFYYNNLFLSAETALPFMHLTFALTSIIAFSTLYKVAKKSDEMMQTNLKLQQMEMENKLNENMADVVNNLRNLRHDMNNHLGILQGFISLQEYEEASHYLDSIMQDLQVANHFVFTDNKLLSVLINSKINHAIAENIPIDTEIHTSTFPLNDKDLCSLIGNILENAIEAASLSKNPFIFFSMKKEDEQLYIHCDNTFLIEPIFHNGKLLTTKDNKKYHGIGTQIINSTVEKYHGNVEYLVDDQFHVIVTIPY